MTTTSNRSNGALSSLFWLQMEGAFRALNLQLAAFWRYTSGALAFARGAALGQPQEGLRDAAEELLGATLDLGAGYAELVGAQGRATLEILSPPPRAEAPPARGRSPGKARSCASFEVFEDGDGHSRFKLVGADGRAMLTSHGFSDERSARRGVITLQKNAVLDERYERKLDDDGARYFELKAGNNRVLWTSASYPDEEALEGEIQRFVATALDASVAV